MTQPGVYICEKGQKPVPVTIPKPQRASGHQFWGNHSNHFGGIQLLNTAKLRELLET